NVEQHELLLPKLDADHARKRGVCLGATTTVNTINQQHQDLKKTSAAFANHISTEEGRNQIADVQKRYETKLRREEWKSYIPFYGLTTGNRRAGVEKRCDGPGSKLVAKGKTSELQQSLPTLMNEPGN